MAGFRLTPEGPGCPPTLAPPSDYATPFRVDGNGAIWIRKCFKGLRYFGAARHDVRQWVVLGDKATPVIRGSGWSADSQGISAGEYRNVTVTNQTECPMGFLLGHDAAAQMTTRGDNQVIWVIEGKWNGKMHSWSRVSNTRWYDDTISNKMTTEQFNTSSCPHDHIFEDTGVPGLVLQPGESATVSAKLHAVYLEGSPSGSDVLLAASSAVRVWGYTLG